MISSFGVSLPVVLGIAAAITGAVAMSLFRRRGRWRPTWLTPLIAAAVALFLLATGPQSRREVTGLRAVVVTAGATAADLDAAASLAPSAPVFRLPDGPDIGSEATVVDDTGAVARAVPGLDELIVAGHGLDAWDLARLDTAIEVADPPSLPSGVLHATWPRHLAEGETLVVAGQIQALDVPTSLLLVGPDGRENEIPIEPGERRPFTLRATPPGTGEHEYELVWRRDDEAVERETIGVRVEPAESPALLWLEGAPGFETREVARWLRDRNASYAIRSTITLDRARIEIAGLDEEPSFPVRRSTLEPFDLIVVDVRSWRALGRSERSALLQSVEERGLGLLLRLPVTAADPQLPPPFTFGLDRIVGLEELAVNLQVPGDEPPPPLGASPFEIDLGLADRPLLTDRANRVLAASRPLGAGRIGVTLVAGTEAWPLAGRSEAHRWYWTRLLDDLARPTARAEVVMPSGPVLVHLPMRIELLRPEETPPRATLSPPNGTPSPVAFRQSPTEPARWTAVVHPTTTGWHRLRLDDREWSAWVAAEGDWSTWRAAQRQAATRLEATRRVRSADRPTGETEVPWPRLPLVVTLIASLGWLWIEERRGV